jgi:hypothetical protein
LQTIDYGRIHGDSPDNTSAEWSKGYVDGEELHSTITSPATIWSDRKYLHGVKKFSSRGGQGRIYAWEVFRFVGFNLTTTTDGWFAMLSETASWMYWAIKW